jgi:hypothetical protein
MFNAADGVASQLTPIPKTSIHFFYTNRSVCEDWLSRIRPYVVRGCTKANISKDYLLWNLTRALTHYGKRCEEEGKQNYPDLDTMVSRFGICQITVQ